MTLEDKPPVIALLTDFGLADPYVGQIKAVLADRTPRTPVVDLCHGVEPHNILQGAFFLTASLPLLPKGAVVMAVVDPGVGSSRRLVLLVKDERRILAPDNGILSGVLASPGPAAAYDVSPTPPVRPSKTFHGRDILAPLAAELANGRAPKELGPMLDPATLKRLQAAEPTRKGDRIAAHVLHIDRFGNAVLNLCDQKWEKDLSAAFRVRMTEPENQRLRRVDAYADLRGDEVGLLQGSQGFYELTMREAPVADILNLTVGDPVVLKLGSR